MLHRTMLHRALFYVMGYTPSGYSEAQKEAIQARDTKPGLSPYQEEQLAKRRVEADARIEAEREKAQAEREAAEATQTTTESGLNWFERQVAFKTKYDAARVVLREEYGRTPSDAAIRARISETEAKARIPSVLEGDTEAQVALQEEVQGAKLSFVGIEMGIKELAQYVPPFGLIVGTTEVLSQFAGIVGAGEPRTLTVDEQMKVDAARQERRERGEVDSVPLVIAPPTEVAVITPTGIPVAEGISMENVKKYLPWGILAALGVTAAAVSFRKAS